MNLIKIAITARDLGLPLKGTLEVAASLGARGLVFDARNEIRPESLTQTGIRQFRKTLDDLNLSVAALTFPTRRGYDSPDQLDSRVDATKKAMTFARALGAGIVINQVGRVPEENSAAWSLMCDAIADLGRHGQRAGALLAANTGSESGADLARLIKALPEGSLVVDLDPGNMIIHGHSPREAVEALGPYIQHVTARDGVRDLAIGRGLEVQLGRGASDFPELFGQLEQHGFRGWTTVRREDADDPREEIGEAIEFLKNLDL